MSAPIDDGGPYHARPSSAASPQEGISVRLELAGKALGNPEFIKDLGNTSRKEAAGMLGIATDGYCPEHWYQLVALECLRHADALIEADKKRSDKPLEPDATTLGWAHAYYCTALDKGEDPRKTEVPVIMDQAKRDFEADKKGRES